MNDYICIGKIINTFGIKGELKIDSDFEYKDRIFNNGFKLYIGEEKELLIILSHRVHKTYDMVLFDGFTNINEVLKYKGKKVFINRNDLNLKEDEYLYKDLIGFEVIDESKSLGIVIDYLNNSGRILFKVKGEKDFYLPNVSQYIERIDKNNKKIYTKGGKNLIL